MWALTEGKDRIDAVISHLIADVSSSLIEHYPNFERMLRESLRALIGEEVERRIEIGLAKDGSGVGGQSSLLFPRTLF